MTIKVNTWYNTDRLLEPALDYLAKTMSTPNTGREEKYVASPISESLFYTILYDPNDKYAKLLEERNLIYDTVTEAQDAALLMIQVLGDY